MNSDNLVPLAVGEQEFDTVYSDAAQYGRIQFWDDRYVSFPEPFEWYYEYDTFRGIFNEAFPNKDAKIMIAGCGNGHFIEDMNDDGYTNLVGVDLRYTLHSSTHPNTHSPTLPHPHAHPLAELR
jgi:2-polyprenyl-3-methyl-5-hydroxy-6-metoxy-1,4-benzoquinol methylase